MTDKTSRWENLLQAVFKFPQTVLILITSTVFFLYMYQIYNFGYIHGDEGFALMASWRISIGQIPCKDFVNSIPPVSFLPAALLFKLMGPTFLAARTMVCIFAFLLILSSDLLLRHLTKSYLLRFMVAMYLIPFGVFLWPITSHHWLVAIFQLLALWSLINSHASKNYSHMWSFLSGLFSSFACFTLQDQGGYFIICLPLVFIYLYDDKTKGLKTFFVWALGGFTAALSIGLYLLPHVSLNEIFHQWFTLPASRYHLLPGHRGSLEAIGLSHIGSQPWFASLKLFPAFTFSQTIHAIMLPISTLLALFFLFSAFKTKWLPKWQTGLLVAGFIAFTGSSMHRYAQTSINWALPVYLVIIGCGFDYILQKGRPLPRKIILFSAYFFILISIIYCVGYVQMINKKSSVFVSGKAGTLRVPASSTQSTMQVVIDAIEKFVPENAHLVTTQYNPVITFWTQRINPTKYDMFQTSPSSLTDEQLQNAITTLMNTPDTYVLLFIPFNRDNIINKFVFENYIPVWRAPWALLMKPKKNSSS